MRDRRRARLDDALYNGINAASISLLCGRREEAESLAREVQEICRRKLRREKTDYWALATLGEAALILGEIGEAEEHYGLAVEAGKGNFGALSTTRRQSRLLLQHMGLDQNRFDRCFRIPGIAVFIGPRFLNPAFLSSSTAMNRLRKKISERLRKIDAGFGYGSAACGPEILFMEEILRRKGEAHIVLPFEKEAFFRSCVDVAKGADWGCRFKRVMARASRRMIACTQFTEDTAMVFEFAGLLHLGLAKLHARILDAPVTPLIIQDDFTHPGGGSVEYWSYQGLAAELIDMREEIGGFELSVPISVTHVGAGDDSSGARRPEQSIKVMLFADVVGYSRMTEERIARFVSRFMGLISNLIDNAAVKPLTGNSWGDALHFVFADVEGAAEFALELRDRIHSTPWKELGLPEDLNLRISLHAWPVFYCEDPVLKRFKYTGSHVSRAARIEPITPPGQIYASQEFAALAAGKHARGFSCDYAGRIPLPKESGTIPLYLIRRGSGQDMDSFPS